jgi:amino acid adenylation domain-containing protein
MEGMLGMVINTLPLRTQVVGDITFRRFLHRVKETCLEAYQHEDTPFGKIVERMRPERSLSYNPIFQVIFSFMDTPGEELRLPNLELEPLETHNRSSKFDINVVVVPPEDERGGPTEHTEFSGETLVEWEYNTDIFDAPTINRMVVHYTRLLESIIHAPGEELRALSMLDESETRRLLHTFNRTTSDYPGDKTIHRLFEEQAQKTPDRIAVVSETAFPRNTLTYRQLDLGCSRLARVLREKGTAPGTIVGIQAERSVEMIAGILAILKTGAGYLPIDPNAPGFRQQYMLEDCGANLLLVFLPGQKNIYKRFQAHGKIGVVDLADERLYTLSHRSRDLAYVQRSGLPAHENFAYVIFTSGSTGTPKGVPITHANFLPLLIWGHAYLGLQSTDRVIQTLSYYFDWSVWEIFLSLTSGAGLYMIANETLLNPEIQLDFIRRHHITLLEITPTQLQTLISLGPGPGALDTLKYLCIGAEKLIFDLVSRCSLLITENCRVFNMYGPTEGTIITAVSEIDRSNEEKYLSLSSVPIGKPVAGSPLLVLDNDLNTCPVNVRGELYIAGHGVAKGYLNDAARSSSVFLKNPYRSKGIKGDYLYKTGDLVRWLPDGEIEFTGRVDDQVKIRGLRIELGEIEGQLLRHDGVKEAVVLQGTTASGDKYLCAYIVCTDAGKDWKADLTAYLSQTLPGYMIPSYFITLERIPLTPSGKIDRKALPKPVFENVKEYEAPRDESEKKLVEIWSTVLGIENEKIGIDSNFFEIGGHSLKATIMAAKIHKLFNLKISLADLFRNPTIKRLAGIIKQLREDRFESIALLEKKEYYSLSYAQKRIYAAHQLELGSTSYNIAIILQLRGKVDRGRLQDTFRELIERHESLRTSFEIIGNEPVQRVHANVEFAIEYRDFEEGITALKNYIRPFDLTQAPLLRVYLSRTGDQEYAMMIDISHLISDGVSSMLIARDLTAFYNRQELPRLNIQYKEFAEWENRLFQSGNIKKQEDFWLDAFKGGLPVLEFPADFPRPDIRNVEAGDIVSFVLKESTKQGLYQVIGETGCTLFTVFMAAYYVLLNKYSGQEDIVIGAVVTGRTHEDLENVMGVFINILPLRNRPQPGKTFRDFLVEIQENALQAFENQGYPMEELVKKLGIRNKPGRYPLFDVAFNLNNIEKTGTTHADFEIKFHGNRQDFAKFDLTLYAIEDLKTIDLYFRYSTQLFKRATIEKLMHYYIEIIEQAVENREIKLRDIKVSHRRIKTKSEVRRFRSDDFVLT